MEQKGMTFDHDFSPFLFPPKKEGRRKGELIGKNRDICFDISNFEV